MGRSAAVCRDHLRIDKHAIVREEDEVVRAVAGDVADQDVARLVFARLAA